MRHIPKVLSFLAVVLCLATTATAAGVLITSSKQIKNGTIRAADLDAKARRAFAAPGPIGPKGEAGAQGEPGPKGEPGPAGALPDGIIGPEKLSFRALQPGDIRVNGDARAGKVTVGGSWETVAGALSRGGGDGGRALLLAAVTLTSPGEGATVQARLLIDGEVASAGWETSLPAGESRVLSFQSTTDLAPGDHTFSLQVDTTQDTLIVGGRSVDLVAFRPIWNPPRGTAR